MTIHGLIIYVAYNLLCVGGFMVHTDVQGVYVYMPRFYNYMCICLHLRSINVQQRLLN